MNRTNRNWARLGAVLVLLIGLFAIVAAASFLDSGTRETAEALGSPHVTGQSQAIFAAGIILVVASLVELYRLQKKRSKAKK